MAMSVQSLVQGNQIMSSRAWEDPPQPVGPLGAHHSWEDSVDDGGRAASDSDSDFENISPGAELVSFHSDLYLNRTLTAKDFSVAMYWAAYAGIPEASDFGFKPNAPSGHQQRHLNSVLPSFEWY
jgi:hypothetical protein